MGLFGKKKRAVKVEDTKAYQLKDINYPPKIILAWAKAVEGNDDIMSWLKANGYKELFMATYAIYLKDEARNWLQKNGYAHLLAFINAAEGNESAKKWLSTHNFDILYHMAKAIDDERESFVWLKENTTQDLFLLTLSIKKVKDQIEENHNDIHTFGQDL